MQKRYKSKTWQSEQDHLNVTYKRDFLTKDVADEYFRTLETNLVYNKDSSIIIYGKEIPIPRKQVAYGEPGLKYKFSGTEVDARDWTNQTDAVSKILLKIRDDVEKSTGQKFNFVLINRYENGDQCIGPHKDDEKELGDKPTIAGVSLGAERDFKFEADKFIPKTTPQSFEIILEHGSLIVMDNPTNKYWKHSIPRRSVNKIDKPRVSLTFRNLCK